MKHLGYTMDIRNEIERVIKENALDRERCFECSKIKYRSIMKSIEQKFTCDNNIHWSNMGQGFKQNLFHKMIDVSEDSMWVQKLSKIIPSNESLVYALFEDVINFQPKYWIYEMCIPELICIIGNVNCLDDFYIVSKKFEWLISENHEDIVSFVGATLDISCFG